MRFVSVTGLIVIAALAGCHSHYISASITNNTGGTLSPVELDYPSASFGTDTLASGATYSYRFKIIGSGPTAVLWTDAAHRDHKAAGPQLHEGDEGGLTVTIGPNGSASWKLGLRSHGS